MVPLEEGFGPAWIVASRPPATSTEGPSGGELGADPQGDDQGHESASREHADDQSEHRARDQAEPVQKNHVRLQVPSVDLGDKPVDGALELLHARIDGGGAPESVEGTALVIHR